MRNTIPSPDDIPHSFIRTSGINTNFPDYPIPKQGKDKLFPISHRTSSIMCTMYKITWETMIARHFIQFFLQYHKFTPSMVLIWSLEL